MNADKKVLACVDHSRFATYVADYAAWAATQMGAPLELLHIIEKTSLPVRSEDHSGAIGVDAQKQLLDTLSADEALHATAARELGRQLLTTLRERVNHHMPISVDIRQRSGELEQTLHEYQHGVELMVLGRRGQSAESTQRDLGHNLERVVRALSRPVLTVNEPFAIPENALFAFDGSAVTRRGVDLLAASGLCRDMPLLLLMSGKSGNEQQKKLDRAALRLADSGIQVEAKFMPGDAETVIANMIQSHGIDLLVMGAYGHSMLRSLVFGSKTADLLRASSVPTLLLR